MNLEESIFLRSIEIGMVAIPPIKIVELSIFFGTNLLKEGTS